MYWQSHRLTIEWYDYGAYSPNTSIHLFDMKNYLKSQIPYLRGICSNESVSSSRCAYSVSGSIDSGVTGLCWHAFCLFVCGLSTGADAEGKLSRLLGDSEALCFFVVYVVLSTLIELVLCSTPGL